MVRLLMCRKWLENSCHFESASRIGCEFIYNACYARYRGLTTAILCRSFSKRAHGTGGTQRYDIRNNKKTFGDIHNVHSR